MSTVEPAAARPWPASRDQWIARVLPCWPYVFVLVGIVVSIGPPLWGDGVLHGADLLGVLFPWRGDELTGFRPDNVQISDTVNAVMPLRAEFARRLHHGDFALWAPDQGSGVPLGTVPDVALFSPLSLPYWVLPVWWAPAVGKALEMGVAAAFTILFLRRLGLGRLPATVGGLVYMDSGFQVAWTNWPQASVGAFVPMLFWAVERAVQLRSARSLVPVALAVAFLFLSGFPAVTAHALLGAGAYALVRTLAGRERLTRRVGRLLALGAGVLLGVGLAAVQLLPFGQRLASLETGYREGVAGQHLPLEALFTSVVPWASGRFVDGVAFGRMNVVESLSFVGAATAVLMVLAAVGGYRLGLPRGARATLWILLGLGVTLVYWGGPLLSGAEHLLPQVFGTNYVGRLRALLCFLCAALAGIGAQVLVGAVSPAALAPLRTWRLEATARLLPRIVVAGAVLTGFVLTAGLTAYHRAVDAKEFAYFKHQLRLPLVVGVVCCLVAVAALLLRRRPTARTAVLVLLPVLAIVQAMPVVWSWWPRIDREEFYPRTPTHRFLEAHLGEDRVVLQQRVLEPGSTSYYGIRTVAAHQFFEQEWRELIEAADPNAFPSGRHTLPSFGSDDASAAAVGSSRILDRLSARYFVADPTHLVLGRAPADPSTGGALTLPAGGSLSAAAPAGQVRAYRLWLRGSARASTVRTRASIHLTVTGPDGTVLARGENRVDDRAISTAGGMVDIAVPQREVPMGSTLRLDLVGSGKDVLLSRAGTAFAVAPVLAQDDGVRTAYADDGAVVYERTGALPRVRWASRTEVLPDADDRIAALAAGVPDDTVVLSEPGPSASGAGATVHVLHGGSAADGDVVAASVTAGGAGYLVVADGLQDGWSATIDGRRAPLVDADHALVAVRVPAGTHRIELHYASRAWTLGRATSAASVVGCGVLFAVAPVRRRRAQRSWTTGSEPSGEPDAAR